jgi:5-methylcytosine-specific restriction endonuclease McrA
MARESAPDRDADSSSDRNLSRSARMRLILERDGARCVWCRREIDTDKVLATTEHLVPRIKGGPSWFENEMAACARCNRERGHRTPADWIDELERRGLEPDRDAVLRALHLLQQAIAERGGQRRARPYVVSQLRRLERGRPQPY